MPRSATGAIGETGQPLPGGVMFFSRVSPTVTEGDRWRYPNIHGDTLVTTDSTGAAVTGLLTYSPDGRPLNGMAGNAVGSVDYGWLGSHSRPAEDSATIIGMGARPYLPSCLGRFLCVDPVEAGTPNDSVYPADPVNQHDLTGLVCVFGTHGGRGKGCRGGSAKRVRHAAIDVAVGVGAGAGVAFWMASVGCGITTGIGIVGATVVAGAEAHKASDALLDDDTNDMSVEAAFIGSAVAAARGGVASAICATTFAMGCIPAAIKTGPYAPLVMTAIYMAQMTVAGAIPSIVLRI